MTPAGDRTKMEFLVPSRGLFGYRNEFLTDTKGEGIMASVFEKLRALQGRDRPPQHRLPHRVGDWRGRCLRHLLNAQERGALFITPGTQVYAGMVVGVTPKSEDMPVNVCRTKHLDEHPCLRLRRGAAPRPAETAQP